MVQENKKGVNGKAFVSALDECQTAEEVFNLLGKTMDKATLKDRVGHVSDNDLINVLHAQKARCNIDLGCRTSHEDCANLAAHRYQQITKKGVKAFKAELNKHITKENTKDNGLTIRMMAMRKRSMSA
ncbi:MAG: hypothetical protein J6C85_03725 [Alphaproteobacteria bacterium]|nr:hypothetical protein [Alphaproteobacteria bacterium]